MAKDEAGPTGKVPVKVYLPADLLESVKEAVWQQRRSLSEFIESAARRELAATAGEEDKASAAPRRLPPGRRPKRPG